MQVKLTGKPKLLDNSLRGAEKQAIRLLEAEWLYMSLSMTVDKIQMTMAAKAVNKVRLTEPAAS